MPADAPPAPRPTRWRWVFLAAIVALTLAGAGALQNLSRLTEATSRVEHTNDVLEATSDFVAQLADAETGQRGYLLTGQTDYLVPHRRAMPAIAADLDRLAALAETAEQRQRVDRVRELAAYKLREIQRTVDLSQAGDIAQARDIFQRGEGKRAMDEIRRIVGEIDAAERVALAERSARVEGVRRATLLFVALTALAAVAVAAVSGVVTQQIETRNEALAREIAERKAAQAAERRSEERLRIAVRHAPITIYAVDRDNRYTWVERSYQGAAPKDMLGRRDDEIFPAEAAAALMAFKRRVMASGVGDRTTIDLPVDGGMATYDVTAQPIRSETGEIEGLTVAAFDVSALQAAKNELAARERFTRSILDSSGDCIQVLDVTGRIQSINPAGRRLLGIGEDESLSDAPWVDMWVEGGDLARGALRTANAGREARFRGLAIGGNGAARWWDVIVTPVSGPSGVSRLVSIARDITDQQRAEAEREELLASERTARSEAERAARAKDEFVATLSHELRTPLNAILGWTHIIRQDRSPETVERGFSVIERNVRLQAQMVDDLLDMNRILSGKIRLDVQRLDLADVIEAALASLEPAAKAKQIKVTTILGSAGPINGDHARLQQVVWNLLSNAIKFTPKGGRVQVTLSRQGSHAVAAVTDNGEGIEPAFLPHVFERFRQADGSASRVHGGLGLGLAIVKQLVELHGGTVTAESPGLNQGTTFTVRVPLAMAVDEPQRFVAVTPRGRVDELPTLTGLRILICDDEGDVRDLITHLLTDRGAEVHAAESVAQAVGWLRDGLRPHVIVSDIGMPRQDGYELIRQVRALAGTSSVPAAALTALARPEDRRRILLAGYQTHVAKPVEPAELVAVVATLAGRTGRGLT